MIVSKEIIYFLCAQVAIVSLLSGVYAQSEPCTTTNVRSKLSVNLKERTVYSDNNIGILCKEKTEHFTVSGINIYSRLIDDIQIQINGSTRKVNLGATDEVSINKKIKKDLSNGKNRVSISYELSVEKRVNDSFEIKVPVLFINYNPSNSKTDLFESKLSFDKGLREINVFPTNYERFENEHNYTLSFSLSVIPSHIRLSLEPQNQINVSTTRIVDVFLLLIVVIISSLVLSRIYNNQTQF